MLRKFYLVPVLAMLALPALAQAQFEAGNWALTLAGAPLSARHDAPQLGVGDDLLPTETAQHLKDALSSSRCCRHWSPAGPSVAPST